LLALGNGGRGWPSVVNSRPDDRRLFVALGVMQRVARIALSQLGLVFSAVDLLRVGFFSTDSSLPVAYTLAKSARRTHGVMLMNCRVVH